jgi:hypothetical protein
MILQSKPIVDGGGILFAVSTVLSAAVASVRSLIVSKLAVTVP